jgi:hypothetical protein
MKESRRIAKIRMGQQAPDYVTLPDRPSIGFAMVPLIEKEYQWTLEQAADIPAPENVYGVDLRDRTMQVCTLLYCLRDPDNHERRVFDSLEQMLDPEVGLEPTEINYLSECYQRMVDFSSPAIDGLDDERLDELKKALVTIDWNALSGKPWWHLKGVFMTLPAGLPLDNSPSLISTLKLIGTSDEPPSTLGV